MAAHDLAELGTPRQLRPEEDHLALEGALLQCPAHDGEDLVILEGLGQIVERAELHRRHRRAHGLHGGDEDHLHLLVDGLDPLEDLDAVHSREADVEEDEVDFARSDDLDGLAPVDRFEQLVVVLQDEAEGLPQPVVVVDDEDDGPHRLRRLDPLGGTKLP